MAVQLMEVVYGVKDNGWLVKLLRGMISGPGAGDKQKKVWLLPLLCLYRCLCAKGSERLDFDECSHPNICAVISFQKRGKSTKDGG